MFDLWCSLLQQTPGSVLWLFADTEQRRANVAREAAARGVAPERLCFAPREPSQAAHLARLGLADLFLDTLPYGAHTTASDALWMGVPVLTCPGATFPSRVAASILASAGVPELICDNLDQYVRMAKRLASEPGLLAELKDRLVEAKQSAPLFDTPGFARDLEGLYRRMYDRRVAGGGPVMLSPLSA
jgi:predicted O-linked N-acetylglucosamine transferase (SPINDLY family)